MIITANQIYGATAICNKVPRGKLVDLLFDDRSWTISYVVIRIGSWHTRPQVLVRPRDITDINLASRRVCLGLSESQLKAAPSLESNPPVALQKYRESQRYLAWDAYWGGVFRKIPDDGDPHLRNTRAVTGHHMFGLDSDAGRVDNFVIDDSMWQIRYLVVRIGKHRDAKRVMIEPRWVDSIVWEERGIHLHLSKTDIEHCGEFIPKQFVKRS
ncbi:MAG: hypothetical protein JW829_21175 [Pirellulales bacterium]|nr:hypothetical protein [Pirellulales bacterium]